MTSKESGMRSTTLWKAIPKNHQKPDKKLLLNKINNHQKFICTLAVGEVHLFIKTQTIMLKRQMQWYRFFPLDARRPKENALPMHRPFGSWS